MSVAADGSVLAWAETFPASRSERDRHVVTVRDGAVTRRLWVGRGGGLVRRVMVAGPFVGWQFESRSDAPDAVVVARTGGHRVLSLRGDLNAAALQADGTVAVLRGVGRRRQAVAVAAPSAPRLRTIASGTRFGERVAIAGGRIVVQTYDRDDRTGFAVVPVAGGSPREIVRLAAGDQQLSGFAFDGRRLTWGEQDDVFGAAATGRVRLVDVP